MRAEYDGARSQQAKEAFIDQPVRAPTQQLAHDRLNQIRPLAAFSLDTLSSIGYANQGI